MIVFTDFECPFCARFAEQTMPTIRRDYVQPGVLRLSIRHLPLESIHPDARRAAAAAICADSQGLFWPIHDGLFAKPGKLEQLDIEEHGRAIGLQTGTFRDCMAAPETQQRISDDIALANGLGIRSTPTILLGRVNAAGQVIIQRHFSGAVGVQALERALDALDDR